jgi:hypothetical protein
MMVEQVIHDGRTLLGVVRERFLQVIKRWRGEPTPRRMTWLLVIAKALGVGRSVS